MASVGELSVDVKARINDFSQNLNEALGQANTFASRMSTIGKKDFFAPVQETIKGMRRDFRQIIQGIVLAQTFYTGLQGFKQLTAAVYEYTDALNYAQVTFSNLFRDVSLGKEFVAVLQDYAARSPFDFTDIEKGARQLSAYGIQAKNLMFVMEGIGNLSAVTGDPQTFDTVSRAMGQIYSKGKLSAEEMRQLAEAGLNVKEVYARLGVEAGSVGKANIDAATALNTIVEVLNDTYAGAMDAANTTMRGMLANTKDVLLSVSSAVFQPAYEKLQRVLKWIQIGIDTFQKTFTTEGLAAAIEKVFGAEALKRIQQFIAICQYLGNVLYQLLSPALRIVAMYGETFLAVFGNIVRVLAPVIELFAALLNTFLNSAQGARLLQAALMGLVVVKIVGGFVNILTASIGLMGKALAGVTSVVTATSGALTILTGAEAGAAAGAYGASAAWKYFTKTLNLNPIVLAITIILTLVAAVMGLRAVLGQTTDALADMSGVDFSKFFAGIKQATGDAEKFSKPFEDAGDAVDDANDGLDKTKKKLEGLLSFDEVFKLPEKADTDGKGTGDDTGLSEWVPTDLGDIELPKVEPLDPRDLLPNIDSILDWFRDQPWWKIGQYISNGIATGIKMAKKLPTKAVSEFIEDLLKTAGKTLDKFDIKERIFKLAEKVKETKAGFKEAGELLGDEAYKALERELGPEKAKKLKLKERLNKIAKEAAKGEKAWSETGRKLAQSLEEDLAKELGPEKVSKYKISEQMEALAKEASKAEAKFAKAGEKLAKKMTGEIEKYLGPIAVKELKIAENLDKIISDAIKGGKAWEEGGAKVAKEWLEGLNSELAKASIKGQSANKAMVTLAKELKEAGVVVTDAGVELSDDFIEELEKGLSNEKSFSEIAKEFGKNFTDAFKSLPKNISKELAEGFTPAAVFAGIKKSFTTEGGESIFKAFTSAIKNAFTPAKIAEFLKTGLKDMGITIIGEMLFADLASWLDDQGLHEASVVMGKVGPILASGLGTAIATKSPWGFVVGAIWGALFEDLGKGLENGDWGSFVGQAAGSLGVVLAKIAPRLGAASAGGPAGWIGAIGSMVSDLIFGSIIQNLRDSGDDQTADILDSIDGAVGGAIGGAGLGATIGSIFPGIGTAIGAVAGAIIGGLVGFLSDNWTQVSDWWNNTAIPWFQNLPENIKNFFTDADKWLSDDKYNPLAGLWNGIKTVWKVVSTFFKGMVELIVGFITGDEQMLHDAGYDLMDAGWTGIQGIWNSDIVKFFKGMVKAIQGFIKDSIGTLKEVGKNMLKGLLNGALAFWNSDIGKFFGGILSSIKEFIKDPGKALTNVGEEIMKGFKGGIDQIWKNIKAFFSSVLDWIIEHKGPIDKDREALKPAGEAIINGLFDGIKDIWKGVKTWFLDVPNKIGGVFTNAGKWLVDAGGNILDGLQSGISTTWKNTTDFFGGVKDKVGGFFTTSGNWLLSSGKNVVSGLQSGIADRFTKTQEFVKGIPEKIKNVFANALNWLQNSGSQLIKGFWEGIKSWWSGGDWNLLSFLKDMPNSIKNVFANALNWLWNSGSQLIKGFWEGIKSWWSGGDWNLVAFIKSFPDTIKNIFTYASTWLYNAGWNIISGFWNGLKERWSYVTGWVSGIGDWIAAHKGPESYDKALLVPAGNWIMEGLESGLQERFKDVLTAVSGFGPQMQEAFATPQLSIGRADVPTITQAPVAVQQPQQQTEEVRNPYLNNQSEDTSQRPILYVGTLIADKQGLRELQKKLDIVKTEQNRYK